MSFASPTSVAIAGSPHAIPEHILTQLAAERPVQEIVREFA